MTTVAGIFQSRTDAERAVEGIRSGGVAGERISLVAPGAPAGELEQEVPTTETEQPGMGGAFGGTIGGAVGAAGGATLGAAAASLLVPGVGPILAAGIVGAALFGAGGAAAGAAAGDALEDTVAGLPHDELFVYEDALRQGRTVVIVTAESDEQGDMARSVMIEAGAESLDAAREDWWIGLRDAEKETYEGQSKDFDTDESLYRRGFEAALHPTVRGLGEAEARERLRARHGVECDEDAFRCGYERGQRYHESLREKHKR